MEQNNNNTIQSDNENQALAVHTPMWKLLPLRTIITLVIGALLPIAGIQVSDYIEARQLEDLKLMVQQRHPLTTLKVDVATINVDVRVNQAVFCEYHAKFGLEGTVEAGIDLDDFNNVSIKKDTQDGSLSLVFPSPRILDCNFNPPQEYHIITKRCNANTGDFEELISHTMKSRILEQIQGGDLLLAAEDSTVSVVESLVENVTNGTPVTVSFNRTDVDDLTLPPNCLPSDPLGWTFQDGRWRRS